MTNHLFEHLLMLAKPTTQLNTNIPPRCLIALKDLKSGAELFVDNTEGFEETGYEKGSSGTGGDPMHQDPLMNIISGQWGKNHPYPPYWQCSSVEC